MEDWNHKLIEAAKKGRVEELKLCLAENIDYQEVGKLVTLNIKTLLYTILMFNTEHETHQDTPLMVNTEHETHQDTPLMFNTEHETHQDTPLMFNTEHETHQDTPLMFNTEHETHHDTPLMFNSELETHHDTTMKHTCNQFTALRTILHLKHF
ncbi:unnamed protein product [Mytilus edulis]|uniref:Uncharacterized protein n=1 Tax=Mytilus edulis TaxID=6550 RepID=A0A8S3TF99_MYTED|nr:unnamed protein product [Mytilus edulis]